jgi:hypothetical protein
VGLEPDGPSGAVRDRNGVCQQRTHPVIGRERSALADPDGGEQSTSLVIDDPERLSLDDRVELVEERDIVGVDGVEFLFTQRDELHLRRRVDFR